MGVTDGPIFPYQPEVPDVADCLEGWKVLHLGGDGWLSSFYNSAPVVAIGGPARPGPAMWPVDRPYKAICGQGHRPPCESWMEDAFEGAPGLIGAYPQRQSCSGVAYGCGIYAHATLASLLVEIGFCPCCGRERAIVRLSMGGRFIPHEAGLRSEYAMVTGIVDPASPGLIAAYHDDPDILSDVVVANAEAYRHEAARCAARYDVPLLEGAIDRRGGYHPSITNRVRWVMPSALAAQRAADVARRATQQMVVASGTMQVSAAELNKILDPPDPRKGIEGTNRAKRDSLRSRRSRPKGWRFGGGGR